MLLLTPLCLLARPSVAFSAVGRLTGQAGLTSEAFFNPDTAKNQPAGYQVLGFGLESAHSGKLIETKAQLRGGVGLSDPTVYNYFLVPEAYVTTTPVVDAKTRYTLGRRILPWSDLDESWRLGVWQPRFRWNYLEPETQGLTGLFAAHKTEMFEIVAFATPLYLPDQGPSFKLKDGAFSSPSQYFTAPASKAALFSQGTRVHYDIDRPAIAKIVMQPATAMMVRYGHEKGTWTRLAYAYKPMNQLLIGVDGYLDLNSYDAMVTAHPRVVYHHVTAWEGGYRGEAVGAWGGLTREWTMSDTTPASWTSQQTSPATLAGAGVGVDAFRWSSEPTRLGASVLKRTGGDENDGGPFANPSLSFFESRYPFHDAVSFDVKTPFPGELGRSLGVSTKVLYELNSRSSALVLRMKYQTARAWTLSLGGEILSAPPEAPTQGFGSDLISRYKANDRVYGGVSYVF